MSGRLIGFGPFEQFGLYIGGSPEQRLWISFLGQFQFLFLLSQLVVVHVLREQLRMNLEFAEILQLVLDGQLRIIREIMPPPFQCTECHHLVSFIDPWRVIIAR